MIRRTPIRRVSKVRARENRVYLKRSRAYLEAHPYCLIWLAKHGHTEAEAFYHGGSFKEGQCPESTECHHMNGRNGWRLLDETEWCAASSAEHAWVKLNQSEARRIGVLK